jgi:hypothetical protein
MPDWSAGSAWSASSGSSASPGSSDGSVDPPADGASDWSVASSVGCCVELSVPADGADPSSSDGVESAPEPDATSNSMTPWMG